MLLIVGVLNIIYGIRALDGARRLDEEAKLGRFRRDCLGRHPVEPYGRSSS
jgi:hypothetical protein